MFVKNSFEYDARVTKEAKSLIALGHSVQVVAIHVPKVTELSETTTDDIQVVRVPRVGLGLGKINAFAQRAAGTVIAQKAEITGKPIDQAELREMASVIPASTATPGQDRIDLDEVVAAAKPVGNQFVAQVRNNTLRLLVRVLRLGVKVAKKVLGAQGRAIKTYAINKRMIKVGLASGADIFHSHDLNTLWIGYKCKSKTGKPLVYDTHELATERNRMGYWWKKRSVWTERRWLPSVDAMIVASPSWIEHNRSLHGSVPHITATVLNVPELFDFKPKDIKEATGLPADLPVLLYQGSIQEDRGIEPAIEAVAIMPDVGMVVVGYGYHRPFLEQLVKNRGLDDRIKFFGPVPNRELLEYTASADIGLVNIVSSSLSYATSLPNKLFEYMMAGIPVIGSRGPDIARIVQETGVGEVAEATDPNEIVEATRRILSDPSPYRSATAQAINRYHWAVEAKELARVYAALSN